MSKARMLTVGTLLPLIVTSSLQAQRPNESGSDEKQVARLQGKHTYYGWKVRTYQIDMPLSFGTDAHDSPPVHNWDNYFVSLRAGDSPASTKYAPVVMIEAQLRYEPLGDALKASIKRLRAHFQEAVFSPVRWTKIDGQDWLFFSATGLWAGVRTNCQTYLYCGPLGKYQIVVYTCPGEVGNDALSVSEAEQAPQSFRFTVDVEKFTQHSIQVLLASDGSKLSTKRLNEFATEMRSKGYQKVNWESFFYEAKNHLDPFVTQTLKVWLTPRSATF